MPSITIPQAVWDVARQVSGRKNPAGFIRNEVLLPWAIAQTELATPPPSPSISDTAVLSYPVGDATKTNLDPPPQKPCTATDDPQLFRRKARLNCVDNLFDSNFTDAWMWACKEWGGERAFVEFLEDQASLPSGRMTNPRGVIIARWRRAGSPVARQDDELPFETGGS